MKIFALMLSILPVVDFFCNILTLEESLIAKSQTTPPIVWTPRSKEPPSNFAVKLVKLKVNSLCATFMWKSRNPNFSDLVTVHSHHRRQTDSETDNISRQYPALQWNCNVRLKIYCHIFLHDMKEQSLWFSDTNCGFGRRPILPKICGQSDQPLRKTTTSTQFCL